MAKSAGRASVVKKNGTAIAGVRSISVNNSGELIDITDQNDSGVTTYLDEIFAGESQEIQISGVEDGQVLRDIWHGTAAGRFMDDLTIEYPNGDEIAGTFVLMNYNETGEYKDAQTFDATLVRSGAETFTAS